MLKPSSDMICADYSIISYYDHGYGWTPDVAFDDVFGTSYSTVLIFGYTDNHVTFQVNQPFYFWFASGYSYTGRNFALLDLTTNKENTLTLPSTMNTWKKYDIKLNAGQYKIYGHDVIISQLFFEREILIQYLIKQNSIIKYYNGVSFINIGSFPVSEFMFENYGHDDVTDITNNLPLLANGNVDLLIYNKGSEILDYIQVKAIPKPTIITSNNIPLSDIHEIQSITLTATEDNNAYVKLLSSPDNGSTWYAYKNNEWLATNNIKNDGNTVEEFNNISTSFNDILISNDKKLKLKFYFEITNLEDSLEIDKLSYKADLKGTFKQQTVNINYTMTYTTNNVMQINITEPGNFKVNY